jgi:hypothetical protein
MPATESGRCSVADEGALAAAREWLKAMGLKFDQHDLETLAALLQSQREAGDQEHRYNLWCLCPHVGKYGDDGEMQCNTWPHADFKRAPIQQLLEHIAVGIIAQREAGAREERAEVVKYLVKIGEEPAALDVEEGRHRNG